MSFGWQFREKLPESEAGLKGLPCLTANLVDREISCNCNIDQRAAESASRANLHDSHSATGVHKEIAHLISEGWVDKMACKS